MRAAGYTVIVHRNGSLDSRQFGVPSWLVRAAVIATAVTLVAVGAIVIAYGPILAAAMRAPLLQRRVDDLTRANARVDQLARALSNAEARYAHLRGMLGARMPAPAGDTEGQYAAGEERLYIAPPMLARAPAADSGAKGGRGPSIPFRWPLSVPSYRTRGMVMDTLSDETHPGHRPRGAGGLGRESVGRRSGGARRHGFLVRPVRVAPAPRGLSDHVRPPVAHSGLPW